MVQLPFFVGLCAVFVWFVRLLWLRVPCSFLLFPVLHFHACGFASGGSLAALPLCFLFTLAPWPLVGTTAVCSLCLGLLLLPGFPIRTSAVGLRRSFPVSLSAVAVLYFALPRLPLPVVAPLLRRIAPSVFRLCYLAAVPAAVVLPVFLALAVACSPSVPLRRFVFSFLPPLCLCFCFFRSCNIINNKLIRKYYFILFFAFARFFGRIVPFPSGCASVLRVRCLVVFAVLSLFPVPC